MITAQLATIPERIECLKEVIASLLPQVDRLNVMLNNFSLDQAYDVKHEFSLDYSCMSCTDLYKLKLFQRDNQKSDGEKYFGIEYAEPGYIFTCDDDILYPPDYVQYMISKIEQYERKHVITLHGRVWSDVPIYSFYRDRLEGFNTAGAGMFRCLETVKGDHFVDCGGDGVMAWHTDTLKMRYEYIELPNMSQLWMALVCNRMGIKQMVVGHEEGYVQQIWGGTGIWDKESLNDSVQTDLVNTRWIKR